MMILTFSVFVRKYPFLANLDKNSKLFFQSQI